MEVHFLKLQVEVEICTSPVELLKRQSPSLFIPFNVDSRSIPAGVVFVGLVGCVACPRPNQATPIVMHPDGGSSPLKSGYATETANRKSKKKPNENDIPSDRLVVSWVSPTLLQTCSP